MKTSFNEVQNSPQKNTQRTETKMSLATCYKLSLTFFYRQSMHINHDSDINLDPTIKIFSCS